MSSKNVYDEVIMLRATKEEKDRWTACADLAGVTLSCYMRMATEAMSKGGILFFDCGGEVDGNKQ